MFDFITDRYIGFEDAIREAVANMLNELWFSITQTFWGAILDVFISMLLIYMVWCCYCVMMSRESVSLPPFGQSKPLDTLFFVCSFYFIIALVKARFII